MLKDFWKLWGKELLAAILLVVVIRAGVAEARIVPTGSMMPTILPGDRLIAEKVVYRFTGPSRGDIVVFKPPRAVSTSDYLKRVIGLPGETVEIRDGQVFINDQPLDEPYIKEKPVYTYGPEVVPPGKLFVLGDNRNDSLDSHVWGFVDESDVRSRAVMRFWPLPRLGCL